MSGRARLEWTHGDRVARVRLAAPKANILDRPMIADLEEAITRATEAAPLSALILTSEGPHFSFGASVEEHLPDQIGDTLTALHDLLARILAFPAPTIAAIRGQCLGGGLELALACDLILAEETAQLGQPEIKLAVFPPAASALLPARIGAGPAAELLLTGESWSGREAASRGLVTRTAADGELDAALDLWLEKDFLPRSPAALAQAVRASRRSLCRALEEDLPALERQYLEELMAEPDALEGITAFLEKRKPRWGRDIQREHEGKPS